jgi:integrase/recombinase XerD
MQHDIERFLAHLSAKTASSQNTVAAYRNDLSQLFQFCQGQVWVENPLDGVARNGASGDWTVVTGTRIAAFIISLKDKGYAATTIARKIAAVKSFFHFLAAEGLLQADPTENLDSPHIEKTLPRSLTHDEVSTLLVQPEDDDAPEGLRDNAMLKLLWSTGVRVSELVALNVDDLDLSSGYVRCLGKANRERIVPVSLDAQHALERYLSGGRTTLVRRRDDPALFVNHRGERLTRQGFWLILKGYARRANLSADVTPQTLRHSFAINQLDQHTDLRSLQELLGHASITTTQVYAQVAGTRARLAREADAAASVQG